MIIMMTVPWLLYVWVGSQVWVLRDTSLWCCARWRC
jgi:hypothetical protein